LQSSLIISILILLLLKLQPKLSNKTRLDPWLLMTKKVKVAIIGLGNVGCNLLQILEDKKSVLNKSYHIEFSVICIADSSGVAIDPVGFKPLEILGHKHSGGKLNTFKGYADGKTVLDILEDINCDLVFEASPVNLTTAEPALSYCKKAIEKGCHLVLANKAPLVIAFDDLQKRARNNNVGILYSATFCGGLPVLNICQRDMIAGKITKIQGVFNATSNFILDEMAKGQAFDKALLETQKRGAAEADPKLDIEGWDTANKLVLLANTVLDVSIHLKDIDVQGITQVTTDQLKRHEDKNETIKLVAAAVLEGNNYVFSVKPTILPLSNFLGSCNGWEMGVEIHSDIYGISYHKLWEREPVPTAASMIRDAVQLCVY